MNATKRSLLAIGAALILAGTAACGSGTETTAGGGGSQASSAMGGSGSLDGGGKQIVAFMPTSAAIYVNSAIQGVKATAAENNYQVTVFENNFDQTQEDQQVQQFIASGQKPAAIIWWPSNVGASVNSVRQLARIAPVFQMNQRVLDDVNEYVTAYAGVNDVALAETAGQQAMLARTQAVDSGRKLSSSGGNLLEFAFSAGYQASDDRHQGFVDSTSSSPFQILATENATANLDAQDGFNHASQLIPAFKPQGIDVIWSHNLDMANGIVTALEQNGYQPGVDVSVVAGNCSGSPDNLLNGKVFSAVIQPPTMEGQLIVRTIVQYLATGQVQDGSTTIPSTETAAPELTMTAPMKNTYLPVAPIDAKSFNTLTIWGLSGEKLCS